MEELCRLCAISKQPEDFRCKIDDGNFDIERKLVTCCNWNSYRSHQNLPKMVCISCFLQLEQCWYFRETVSRAQQKLCDLLKIDSAPKPLHELESYTEPTFESELTEVAEIEVKIENTLDETVEVGEIEVTDLKVEDDFNNFSERLEANSDHDDAVVDDDNYNYYEDHFSENSYPAAEDSVKVKNLEKSTSKPKPVKQKSKRTKQKPKHVPSKSKTKKIACNNLEFDIKAMLSHGDVNENGTVKKEKIMQLNLCDWTAVKHRCYQCNGDFNSHSDLWTHFVTTHSNEKLKFICPICPDDMVFLSGRYYRNHIAKSHYPHLTYCCHRCQAFFHDTKKMREHLRSHPKDPSLSVCPTCGKKFYYYKNLHFHMLSHLPIELQPQFECYLCKKPSKSHQSLQKHIKFHVGIFKSAVCEQCGKAFVTPSKLKKHMTTHTDDRPFTCDVCKKTFKTTSILRRHARIHQNFKAYVCDICGHRTLDKCALKLHIIRYHTEDSPFPCRICGNKFYSARTMKTHQKNMHFDHKPFPCSLCDHRAINQNALQRHHKHVHLDHRPHACHSCEYRTYSKHNLRLHVTRRHGPIDNNFQPFDNKLNA